MKKSDSELLRMLLTCLTWNDFYDILNCILQNKGLIPKGNDKAILLSKDKLNDYITDETIVLKTILEDTGYNTWVSKIILNNPLMVGGL